MLMALMHAASAEVRDGRIDAADAESAVVHTVVGALAAAA